MSWPTPGNDGRAGAPSSHHSTDAVGGIRPSEQALATTRDLLIAIPDPVAAIEALAGRADPATVLPTIR